MRSALIFLTVIAALFTIFSSTLAGIFTTNEEVRQIIAHYLIIISWGFGFIEVHRYSTFVYIGCGKPALAAGISALRIVGLLIPLSALAWYFDWLSGIFWARLVADLISGSIGWYLTSRLTRRFPADGVAMTI